MARLNARQMPVSCRQQYETSAGKRAMPLMTKSDYRASLQDDRVVSCGRQRVDDILADRRFAVPIETALRDYDYDHPERGAILAYDTEDGDRASRIYQEPRTPADLVKRVELGRILGEVGIISGVYMAMLSIRDQLAKVNPQFSENVARIYLTARQKDLRAAQVITDAKGDRSRKAHEQDDPDLYLR